jgi:hypothetical protein
MFWKDDGSEVLRGRSALVLEEVHAFTEGLVDLVVGMLALLGTVLNLTASGAVEQVAAKGCADYAVWLSGPWSLVCHQVELCCMILRCSLGSFPFLRPWSVVCLLHAYVSSRDDGKEWLHITKPRHSRFKTLSCRQQVVKLLTNYVHAGREVETCCYSRLAYRRQVPCIVSGQH